MIKTCPLTGVHIWRFITITVLGFVAIWAMDFLFHAIWLKQDYIETASLWRPEAEMLNYMPWMMAFQFALAAITAFIYTRNHEGKGLWEGVRFGWMLGLFWAISSSAAWVWLPISAALALKWGIGGLATGLVLGIVYSLIYKAD